VVGEKEWYAHTHFALRRLAPEQGPKAHLVATLEGRPFPFCACRDEACPYVAARGGRGNLVPSLVPESPLIYLVKNPTFLAPQQRRRPNRFFPKEPHLNRGN